jgi:hypothetical protein
MVVDSIRTAYYHKGGHPIITLIQFLGWISILTLGIKVSQLNLPELLPSFTFNVEQFFSVDHSKSWLFQWEPVFILLAASYILIFLSGRILEEAES